MRLTNEELVAISERAEKASPGPWKWSGQTEGGFIPQGAYLGDTLILLGDHYENYKEDAEFIAHAREDIPRLVAEVERLRDVISRCECAFCSDELGDNWRLVSGLVVCEECESIYGCD